MNFKRFTIKKLIQTIVVILLNFNHSTGFTPLILASTAGHAGVVKVLAEKKADLEAQSDRTKDTPLSLACSGGRVVRLNFYI